MVFMGKMSHSAYSFSNQLVVPSGPEAFAGLRLDNNLKLLSSNTSRNSGLSPLMTRDKVDWAVCIPLVAQGKPC